MSRSFPFNGQWQSATAACQGLVMTVAWFVTMGWLGRLVEEMRMEGGAAGAEPELSLIHI